MRVRAASCRGGIALVIVMISIFVLTMLAAGFAFSMKVETRLGQHASNETELHWLGRSGVEYCRWVLALQAGCPMEPYDSLDQVWAGGTAGGPCSSNGPLMEVQQRIELGHGSFTWKITDMERKWNINAINDSNQAILQQALLLMGVDASEMTPIVGAILDWMDADNIPHLEGAEANDYKDVRPKNGPLDDLSELLMVRGVTPEMFSVSNRTEMPLRQRSTGFGPPELAPAFNVGFAELFTTMSSGRLNINTCSAEALQLIPGVDEITAQALVAARAGQNDGTGLTGPFLNTQPQYLWTRVPGLNLDIARRIQQFADVRSRTFQCEITATVGPSTRTFYATIVRNNPRDLQVVNFYSRY